MQRKMLLSSHHLGSEKHFRGVFCTSRPGLGDEKDTQRAFQDDTECPNGTECPNRLSGRAAITRSLSTLPQTPSGQPPTKMRGYPETQKQQADYQPLPNQSPDNPPGYCVIHVITSGPYILHHPGNTYYFVWAVHITSSELHILHRLGRTYYIVRAASNRPFGPGRPVLFKGVCVGVAKERDPGQHDREWRPL